MKVRIKAAYTILPLLLLMGLSSCEDFFITELEIPRQDLDNQLVIHSFVSDIDSSLDFKVAKNFGLDAIFEESESIINDASIKIFRGSDLLHEIEQDTELNYHKHLDGLFGASNENFKIEVIHPDYETAYVETDMPEFVTPESITFTKDGGFTGPGGEETLDLIQITINDPADQENYYEFQIQQIILDSEEIIFGEDTFYIETRYPDNYFSPDGNITQGISGFLLSDELFNGQTYSLQVMLDSYESPEEIPVDLLRVTWNCVSKDHFNYSKTLVQYQRSAGFGLFSDPIAVFSNVENGLGVVSLRTSRSLEVVEK